MQSTHAQTQYQLSAADLEVVLALTRAGNLAGAGVRLALDPSTVFRSLQRIEHGLGETLFERSRRGYRPTEAAQRLARHAERIESELEAARGLAHGGETGSAAGSVRITTTESVLSLLVLPALRSIAGEHPLLRFELLASNELANLTQRDADIALRATQRPPEHLVGRMLGPIRVAIFAANGSPWVDADPARAPWIGLDDALPEHPSVLWRRRRYPKLEPRWRVNSVGAVADAVALGLGIGVLPLFCGEARAGLQRLGATLDDAETPLWLLAHPESRHLRRVAVVAAALAQAIRL